MYASKGQLNSEYIYTYIYFFLIDVLIEFSAVPAHIDTYQFGDSANHLFSMLCFL